ncbi:MAG: C25 family cysteine peptidase [Chitinophagaceae bacterium]
MKRILLVLLIAMGLYAQAQVYNNEWIDYSKTYYKFKVATTGLYRIPQSVLSGAGLGAVPAEQFQLWRNGQQIPIYTSVPTGALGGSDYIEFWGEMNDGKPDNALYRNPDYQLNDKWSLQTDTAAFFLTVNPGGGNFHYSTTTNNVAGNTLAPEPFFVYIAGNYYRDQINPGYAASVGEYVYSASYDIGEGWTSPNVGPVGSLNYTFSNLHVYSGGPDPSLRVNVSGNAINPRSIRVKVNGDSTLGQEVDYFDYAKMTGTFPIGKLSSDAAAIEMANICNVTTDRMVVHKVELTYPRQFNFDNLTNFKFTLSASSTGNYLEISNFQYGSTAPVLYDLTNGTSYIADITNPALIKIALLPSATDRQLLLVSRDVSTIKTVTSLQTRNFVNYAQSAYQGDYIIISHPNLNTSSDGTNYVEAYRAYRASAAGGGFTSRIYDINQLVDQFGFGIKKHPLSIRNFLGWARANFALPLKNVFLIGHGITYQQYRTYESDPNSEILNMVPTWGDPASDNLLSSTFTNPVPLTPIGRISVINGDEIKSYFQKVKEYETAQASPSPYIADKAWMKNVVHVVGSSDEQLGVMLTDYMDKY